MYSIYHIEFDRHIIIVYAVIYTDNDIVLVVAVLANGCEGVLTSGHGMRRALKEIISQIDSYLVSMSSKTYVFEDKMTKY